MAFYFSKFPTIQYSMSEYYTILATNIAVRFAFESKFKNNTSAYYKYVIKDDESPEIVAYKAYGSAERHWIVLYMNDIIDPYYDWPLNYVNFNKYIIDKYGSIEYAQTTTHSYYKVIESVIKNGKTITQKYQIDSNTYSTLPVDEYTPPVLLNDGNVLTIKTTKEVKSLYDFELEVNDKKREIILLKNEFVEAAELELQTLGRQ